MSHPHKTPAVDIDATVDLPNLAVAFVVAAAEMIAVVAAAAIVAAATAE